MEKARDTSQMEKKTNMASHWEKWAWVGSPWGKWVQQGEDGYSIGEWDHLGETGSTQGKEAGMGGKTGSSRERWALIYISIEVLGLVCFSFKFRAKLNRIPRVPICYCPHVWLTLWTSPPHRHIGYNPQAYAVLLPLRAPCLHWVSFLVLTSYMFGKIRNDTYLPV